VSEESLFKDDDDDDDDDNDKSNVDDRDELSMLTTLVVAAFSGFGPVVDEVADLLSDLELSIWIGTEYISMSSLLPGIVLWGLQNSNGFKV
jgi:hypothetical protein